MKKIIFAVQKKMFSSRLSKEIAGGAKQLTKPISFENTKSIGVLVDCSRKQDLPAIQTYVEELKNQGKTVEVLGYNSSNHTTPFKTFTNKITNWYGVPKDKITTNFINTPFDILIALYWEKILPLDYVLAHSKAHLKIGQYHAYKKNYLDIMIDVSDTPTMVEFVETTKKWLSIVNREEKKVGKKKNKTNLVEV